MKSKWQILEDRLETAKRAVAAIEAELEWARNTPFQFPGTAEPGQCSKCKTELATEEAFWKHYLVPDERFVNLGQCPNK